MTYTVSSGTLNSSIPYTIQFRLELHPDAAGKLTVLPEPSSWWGGLSALPLNPTHSAFQASVLAWAIPLLEMFWHPCVNLTINHTH